MATSTEPSLPKLLASLGLGARSVNSLPLTRETNNVDSTSDGSNNDDGDDAAADDADARNADAARSGELRRIPSNGRSFPDHLTS